MKTTVAPVAEAPSLGGGAAGCGCRRRSASWPLGEGGVAGADRRCRPRRARRTDGGRGRRGRRREGQARPGAGRGAARPRGGRGNAGRAPCRGRAASSPEPTAAARCALRPTSTSPTVTRSAGGCSSRCSPASRPAAYRAHPGAGRRRGRSGRARPRARSVSREFVDAHADNLLALMSRRLDDVRLAVLMLDGIDLKGRCCVVALGITTDGVKLPLGLWDGSTENATVATALLSNLVDRGLDLGQGMLCVIDGSKALARRSATCSARSRAALHPAQGTECARTSGRARPGSSRMSAASGMGARRRRPGIDRLPRSGCPERSHPGAAGSLREGLAETLTVGRLGVEPLKRTLASTNPCEVPGGAPGRTGCSTNRTPASTPRPVTSSTPPSARPRRRGPRSSSPATSSNGRDRSRRAASKSSPVRSGGAP